MIRQLLIAAGVVFAYVNVIHVIALLKKDNGIMDAAWGPGFVLLAWSPVLAGGGAEPRQLLLAALVTLWGLRLCVHILLRNAGRGEDFRCRKWRESWGRWLYVRSYLQIFMLQGFFMVVLASFYERCGEQGAHDALWRLAIHASPQLFSEALLWWGCFLIAASVPGRLWSLVSPVVIA